MDDHKEQFPVATMAETLGVSRSGYYQWAKRPLSDREQENKTLTKRIRQIWEASRKTYGSPRIHAQLVADGHDISRPRVARLMKNAAIQSQIRPKWVLTTDSMHELQPAPNLLDRQFKVDRLAQAWVSDITYLPGPSGWLYVTTVMDLADRQIIGWTLTEGLKAIQTTIPAFQMAWGQRRPGSQELIFHSDRGIQYACKAFTQLLEAHEQISRSMSRKGNCWDNAPAESFFKTFKAELSLDTQKSTYQQIRAVVFEFIEIWYNRKRLHSSLDYKTPAQAEQLLIQKHNITR